MRMLCLIEFINETDDITKYNLLSFNILKNHN